MNAMTRTLAIVAIVLASTLAPAHALTTREWQGACESPDLGQQALCATYAAGWQVFDIAGGEAIEIVNGVRVQ